MQETKAFESLHDVMAHLVAYLPTLLAGLVVLVLGAVAAWIVSAVTVRILVLLRLDRVVVRLRWGRALEKGDVRRSLFSFVGTAAGVLTFLVFLENAILIWKLTVLSELLQRFVELVPRLLLAFVVLVVGWGVASGVSRSVQRALYQEEFDRARLAARLVRAAILVVACAIALVELQIAVTIVTGAFLIAFGALALSFVLAFGLGSRHAVETMWDERFRRSRRPEGEEERRKS